MKTQKHSEAGKFLPKSTSERKVRSIRTTDRVWDDFGFMADERKITRADLLEQWVQGAAPTPRQTTVEEAIAVQYLKHALTLKANAGGAIKAQIRKALEVLE